MRREKLISTKGPKIKSRENEQQDVKPKPYQKLNQSWPFEPNRIWGNNSFCLNKSEERGKSNKTRITQLAINSP